MVRVGGTSIQLALFPHLGERDIVTSISPSEGNYHPRNIQYKKTFKVTCLQKKFLGPDIYNAFVFTIERNFVDKVISFYAMEKYRELQRNNCNLRFNEFINRKNFPQDLNKYSICAGNALYLL